MESPTGSYTPYSCIKAKKPPVFRQKKFDFFCWWVKRCVLRAVEMVLDLQVQRQLDWGLQVATVVAAVAHIIAPLAV